MKGRSLLIFLIILLSLAGVYYASKGLQRVIRPRESAGRFFLFFLANFFLTVVTIVTVVALIVKLFPR